MAAEAGTQGADAGGKGAPAPGAGQAGTGDGNGSVKHLTQEDVNRIVAAESKKDRERLATYQAEVEEKYVKPLGELRATLAKTTEEYTSLKADLAELKKLNTPPAEDADEDPFDEFQKEIEPPAHIKDKDLRETIVANRKQKLRDQAAMAALRAELEAKGSEVAEIRKSLEALQGESKQRAEEAKVAGEQRLVAERRAAISAVVSALPTASAAIARALTLDIDAKVERDTKTGEYFFRVSKSERVPLTTEDLRPLIDDSFLRPATDTGGSGASNRQASGSGGKQASGELDGLKNRLQAIRDRAANGPISRNDRIEHEDLRRQIYELEQQKRATAS